MSPHGATQREIIAHVSRALTAHSFPPLDARTKAILASQVGHLLRGGYPADRIQTIATNLALDPKAPPYWSELARIGQHVRHAVEETAKTEHMQRIQGDAIADPRVAQLVAVALHRIPSTRVYADTRPEFLRTWTKMCSGSECKREALFRSTTCSDHTP